MIYQPGTTYCWVRSSLFSASLLYILCVFVQLISLSVKTISFFWWPAVLRPNFGHSHVLLAFFKYRVIQLFHKECSYPNMVVVVSRIYFSYLYTRLATGKNHLRFRVSITRWVALAVLRRPRSDPIPDSIALSLCGRACVRQLVFIHFTLEQCHLLHKTGSYYYGNPL